MTITTLPTRNEYTATSGQTVFNYTFKIFASTDLNVYQTAAGVDPDDATDLITAYSVAGVGDEDGGTITLTTGATTGDKITIVSNIPESRTTDYQNNGDFRPSVVNADFDRVVSLAKQSVELAERGLSFQESEQISTLSLPLPLRLPYPQAGYYMRWKGDLTGLENVAFSNDSYPGVSGLTVTMLANITGTLSNGDWRWVTGRATHGDGGHGEWYWSTGNHKTLCDTDVYHGVSIPLTGDDGTNGAWLRAHNGIINTQWFGVISDSGTTNNSTALNSMVDVMSDGETMWFPKESGYYQCNTAVVIDKPMAIIVDGDVRPSGITDDLFRVTSDSVFFTGSGVLQGPGTYNQAGAATYYALITFLGTAYNDRILNCVVDGSKGLRILEPPWAGVQFRYCTNAIISNIYFEGGPTTFTGTNHFCILAIDSRDVKAVNNSFRENSSGGKSVQFFDMSVIGISSAPVLLHGNYVENLWEKLCYISGADATITDNYVLGTNISDAIRVYKGRNVVTGNNLRNTWGIDIFADSEDSIIANNVITEYSHNAISVLSQTIGDIGTITICNNIISSLTTDDNIYEGIIVKTSLGGDISNILIHGNLIENADLRVGGGNSAALGAIGVTPLVATDYVYNLSIKDNLIIGAGVYGMRLENLQNAVITGNEIVNAGNDDAGTVNGVGINIRGDSDYVTISNNRFGDDRGGSSRYLAAMYYASVTTPHYGHVVENNISWSLVAGADKSTYQIGDPAAATALIQVKGNSITPAAPLYGTFTMPNAAVYDVVNANIRHTTYPNVMITAVNASAAQLMGGLDHLYIFSKTAGTGFRVATGNGGNAVGTEIFYYEIIQ